MKFEYVISGLNFAYLLSSAYRADAKAVAATRASIEEINQNGTYNVSALFNAYAETNNGKPMTENYRDVFHNVHVDSGGLQVITRGLEITPALKRQIYTVQAEHADVAMCFDEIPLRVTDAANSNRYTTDAKVFVRSDLDGCALKTAANICEQLRVFAELGSDAKVMMIVQGNDRHDFARWGEVVYNAIDDDLKGKLHGLAMADTCCGNGALETVEMCAAIPMMNVPDSLKKNIHFLGVGSLSRLVPIIELSRTPMFADKIISFDSTSHSSTIVMGKMTDENGKMQKLGKTVNRANIKFFKSVYDDITKFYGEIIGFDEYIDYVISKLNTTRHLSDVSDPNVSIANMTYWFAVRRCVDNFMASIERCRQDPSHYFSLMSTHSARALRPMLLLADAKDVKDLDRWFELYSKRVNSNRIPRVDDSNEIGYSDVINLLDIA